MVGEQIFRVLCHCELSRRDVRRRSRACGPFVFVMCTDDIGNRRFRKEVIEAVPLVRYDKKILTAIVKECGDLGQMTNEVWLVFNTVDANRCSKSIINPREVAGR